MEGGLKGMPMPIAHADFYAGVERTLRRVAVAVDGGAPGGAHADAELLRQMVAECPGVRPAVLSEDTVGAPGEFGCPCCLVVDGRSSESCRPAFGGPR